MSIFINAMTYDQFIEICKIIAPFLLGVFVLIATIIHNRTQAKIAHDKMEKELFSEFNARYDVLNEYLEEITKYESLHILEKAEITEVKFTAKQLRYKLNDYFNLCAEEYYWFTEKKRISDRIWDSWHTGMNSWYQKHSIIREVWKQELEKYGAKSFYLDNGYEFFQNPSS